MPGASNTAPPANTNTGVASPANPIIPASSDPQKAAADAAAEAASKKALEDANLKDAAQHGVKTDKKADDKKADDAHALAAKEGRFHITLSKDTAKPGELITVRGSGFGSEQGTSLVVVDGASVQAERWNDTSIEFKVPPSGRLGLVGQVVVAVGDKQHAANFTTV